MYKVDRKNIGTLEFLTGKSSPCMANQWHWNVILQNLVHVVYCFVVQSNSTPKTQLTESLSEKLVREFIEAAKNNGKLSSKTGEMRGM